jgi:hypothetical protein
MARLLVGPIPEPADLFGRDASLADYRQALRYTNLLLLAPRRFGKSGLMRHLMRNPPDGLTPIWLHLEDVQDGPQFAARLIAAVRTDATIGNKLKAIGQRGAQILSRLEEIGIDGIFQAKLKPAEAAEWPELAAGVLAALEGASQPILFLWDELPAMLATIAEREGPEKAREYLAWFRSLRLDGNDHLRLHRFVVAGSTGLNYLLDRRLARPELINDFRRVEVGPLEAPADRELCTALAGAARFTVHDKAIDHLLKRIGQPVPYFIQLFFAQAELTRTRIGAELTISAIDAVFKSHVVGRPCKAYFDQYRRRLQRYLPEVEAAVVAMLAVIAMSPGPVDTESLYAIYRSHVGPSAGRAGFADLLADLECDWYLECNPETGTYSFYMAVMRDWWRRWYRPAALIAREV